MIQNMDSAEKKFNERQSRELVAFMSLETMFPDPKARALAKAAGAGNIKKIEQLVNAGVSVNSKGTNDATPLFWAMSNFNGFKRLLELGADPNVVFGDGGSVMHWAVTAKDERILKAALEHGGNPNLKAGQSEGTPLFEALSMGTKVVDTLLDAGADINSKDKDEDTPVMIAAGSGRFEIVYQLLERGADYRIKNRNGRDLADRVASKRGLLKPESESAKWMEKVIEWLQGKGVVIPPNPRGQADRRQADRVSPLPLWWRLQLPPRRPRQKKGVGLNLD